MLVAVDDDGRGELDAMKAGCDGDEELREAKQRQNRSDRLRRWARRGRGLFIYRAGAQQARTAISSKTSSSQLGQMTVAVGRAALGPAGVIPDPPASRELPVCPSQASQTAHATALAPPLVLGRGEEGGAGSGEGQANATSQSFL